MIRLIHITFLALLLAGYFANAQDLKSKLINKPLYVIQLGLGRDTSSFIVSLKPGQAKNYFKFFSDDKVIKVTKTFNNDSTCLNGTYLFDRDQVIVKLKKGNTEFKKSYNVIECKDKTCFIFLGIGERKFE